MPRASHDGLSLDPLRMAAHGEAKEGNVDARSLEAVADALAPGNEPVDIAWRIEGGRSAEGRPMLAVHVEGAVPLTCQRCLASFEWPLARTTRVLLARDEAELAVLDNESDDEVIDGSARIGAQSLVGDEILLTLPFAPVHPDACP
jgi:uncharacterized protein